MTVRRRVISEGQRFSTCSSCVLLRKVCCVYFALKLRQDTFAQVLYVCLCRTLIEHTKALDPTRPVTYITDSNYAKDKGVGACLPACTLLLTLCFCSTFINRRVYRLIGWQLLSSFMGCSSSFTTGAKKCFFGEKGKKLTSS